MVDVALSLDGKPDCDLRRLDDGRVVPAVSPEQLQQLHRETIAEQVTLGERAEDLGYDYVSHPEIHFPLLATLSPDPLMTQMAIARSTTDIGLLPSVVLDWHDPVRLAERFGMLDVISDGRLEVGLARGVDTRGGRLLNDYYGQYWGGTDVDEPRQLQLFEEKFEILLRAWTETLFSYDGEFHQVPTGSTTRDPSDVYLQSRYLETDQSDHATEDYLTSDDDGVRQNSLVVAPQPAQKPHPPLWLGVGSAESARWAARRGINGLGLSRSFEDLARLVETYHETARAADWPDRTESGVPFDRGWDAGRARGVAASVSLFNTDVADEETVERWKRGKEFVVNHTELNRTDDPEGLSPASVDVALDEWDVPIFGSTDEVVAELRRLRELCGYEDLLLLVSFDTHGLTTDEKLAQMTVLVEDVLPRLD